MVTVILQHEVLNFAPQKVAFDADQTNHGKHGLKIIGVFTSAKNPNDVTVIMEFPSADVLGAMMSNPNMAETMKNSRVISEPVINVLNKV